jgi:hypothetical protein
LPACTPASTTGLPLLTTPAGSGRWRRGPTARLLLVEFSFTSYAPTGLTACHFADQPHNESAVRCPTAQRVFWNRPAISNGLYFDGRDDLLY